jgi:hypothetical protein
MADSGRTIWTNVQDTDLRGFPPSNSNRSNDSTSRSSSASVRKKASDSVRGKALLYPIGVLWIENDADTLSGEALAEWLIYSQRYFESRFRLGLGNRVAWLPGLTGALP